MVIWSGLIYLVTDEEDTAFTGVGVGFVDAGVGVDAGVDDVLAGAGGQRLFMMSRWCGLL